jgi:hypothetical protein
MNVWGINDVHEIKKIWMNEEFCGEDIWKHQSKWPDVTKLGHIKSLKKKEGCFLTRNYGGLW